MTDHSIPAPESLAAHERAAAEITGLRRKGIHCHLEERPAEGGHCIDVVVDKSEPAGHEDHPSSGPGTPQDRHGSP